MTLRVGTGYDVHAFAVPPIGGCGDDMGVVLGGVSIPHPFSLKGHSDADVLIHAVCDALLGATGLGDIGRHFSDTDPTWKGADSRKFLRELLKRAHAKGFRVVNVDATVVAERPRLAAYVSQMVANLAVDFGIPIEAVNVKATTEEKMGFTGAYDGISAQAAVLVEG